LAIVALLSLIAFAAVAFGWRVWLQYRRTGDTGLRAGARTAPEVLSTLVLASAVVAITLAPVLDLANALVPTDVLVHPAVQATGIACFVLGFVLTVRAQLDMGASWRVGVDTTETTTLITHGVFRHVRNPIFSGMVLAFVGVAFLVPNVVAFVGIALAVIGLEIHVRVVEEPHLMRAHGERYMTYARSAGRFVPGCGRVSGSASSTSR
jgi:protein-S-isoprenylcysteine O-methyltransferase Ste14